MIEVKNLGNGQLPAAKGTLYTVPALTTAVVLQVTLVNASAAARLCNLYYKKAAGTSRRITPQNLSLLATYKHVVDDVETMGAGDEIEGDADAAASVDYVISGYERTT